MSGKNTTVHKLTEMLTNFVKPTNTYVSFLAHLSKFFLCFLGCDFVILLLSQIFGKFLLELLVETGGISPKK